MDLSQLALQPVLATALETMRGNRPGELSFERGDLIEVQRDLGDGTVFGANVSRGSITGTLQLRFIELNLQTQMMETTQLLVEDLLQAKLELAEARSRREAAQQEVATLREAKEELEFQVNPFRYGVRTMEDLLIHLTQTDIGCVEIAELVRESQNDWTSILADIKRLQTSVDDPELDPFRRLVLDRCDGLRKRVAALVGPATDTITSCKLLHTDLENIWNAIHGLPMLPRPTRSASEHLRSASQGALSSIPPSNSASNLSAASSSPLKSFVIRNQIGSSAQSSATLSASAGSLPEFVHATTSPSSTSPTQAASPLSMSSSDILSTSPMSFSAAHFSLAHTSPDLGGNDKITTTSNSASRGPDRAAVLGGQRLNGSSSSLLSDSGAQSAPLERSDSASSPSSSKFVLGTKPGSIKSQASSSGT